MICIKCFDDVLTILLRYAIKIQLLKIEIALQIADKDSAVDEWKKKYEDMRNDYDVAQKNVERLQQYMADLPTSEDYSKRNHEISFTTKARKKYLTTRKGGTLVLPINLIFV